MKINTNERAILERIRNMYVEYGVNTMFLDKLDDIQKIKGMKGILAELDLNRTKNYSPEDLIFIQQIYSMFC